MWYWHKDRQTEHWSQTENREISPHICSQLIFTKGARKIQWGDNNTFQQMVLVQLDIHMQKNEVDLYITL